MTRSPTSRPEHAPKGHEWLPDAFRRDAAQHGHFGLETVRQALAEGQIVAILRAPLGHRYEIPQRIWDKEPVERKVFPRFSDGWARIGLNEFAGPHVEGWIFVPIGSIRDAIENAARSSLGQRRGKYSAAKLRTWYREYVKQHEGDGVRPSRGDDLSAARQQFGQGVTHAAVRKLRHEFAPLSWKCGGRPKSGRK